MAPISVGRLPMAVRSKGNFKTAFQRRELRAVSRHPEPQIGRLAMKKIDQSLSSFFCCLWVVLFLLLGTVVGCFVSSGHAAAEVIVSGTKDLMTVEARNSDLDEIASEIGKLAKVKIDIVLASKSAINGRYTGSLRYVLSRILLGHNYVMKQSQNQISIVAWTGSGPAPFRLTSSNVPPGPVIANPPVQGWHGGFSFKPVN